MKKHFTGAGVAIITPFNADKSIDYTSLESIINNLIDNGTDYIVALGTTSESATLSKEEKDEVLAFIIEKTNKRVPIILGLGGNNTKEITNAVSKVNTKDISGILSVSPYYNKPIQEGIFRHYEAISKESPLPIILYNVPGRTSSNISADTTLRLANGFENIVAIKEASGNIEQCMKIIKHKPEEFVLLSGDDALTFPLMCLGAEGVISVAIHANPKEFSKMVKLALNHNYEGAKKIHYELLDMMTSIFEEGNPGGIKALLSHKGLCKNELRLPLWKVSDALSNKLLGLI